MMSHFICIGCAKVIERRDTEWHFKQCAEVKGISIMSRKDIDVETNLIISNTNLNRSY